jgi:chemotaxis protein methyltransferase CheR
MVPAAAKTSDSWRNFGTMSGKIFSRIAGFIHAEVGIKMPDSKLTMLQGRLQKRLRHLRLSSYDEYAEYLFSPDGMQHEMDHLINAVTTNKTDFFREPRHYDILLGEVLPGLYGANRMGLKRIVHVWSAACSTGEEPYTLAMVLSEFGERHQGLDFSILGTDISTHVLEKARLAIYEEDAVEPIPSALRKKYLLRGTGENKGLVRIAPELRFLVRFQRINLLEETYGIRDLMDIIFCRNVMIYFDRPTQEKVLNSLVTHLRPGGYLFMGHSETLNGMKLPVVPVALTVYRKVK